MCNEVTIIYDKDGYEKSLERLVAMSEKEYFVQMVDINRHQVIVAKTLLWIMVIIIGFDLAFIEWSLSKASTFDNPIAVLVPTYLFILISIISALIGFAYSAMAIPALGGYRALYKNSWADYSTKAFNNLRAGNDSVYGNTLNDLLGALDQACELGQKTNSASCLNVTKTVGYVSLRSTL